MGSIIAQKLSMRMVRIIGSRGLRPAEFAEQPRGTPRFLFQRDAAHILKTKNFLFAGANTPLQFVVDAIP